MAAGGLMIMGRIWREFMKLFSTLISSFTLASYAAVGLFLLLGAPGLGQEEPAGFEIRLPPEISSDQVQADYVLTGRFGIHGDVLKVEPERNVYQIGTSVKHQAAETLKLILYAPGCQIVTVTVPSLSVAEKTSDVTCEDLPSIDFKGRVELPGPLGGRPYEVEINYMAYWAHDFFAIKEAPITTFHVARVAPDAGGAFHLRLPNFTKDAVTESFRRNAGLRFLARERDTGNLLALLGPANVEGKTAGDLPIKAKFPAEVLFKPIPAPCKSTDCADFTDLSQRK
jgi:hypothetical protein